MQDVLLDIVCKHKSTKQQFYLLYFSCTHTITKSQIIK